VTQYEQINLVLSQVEREKFARNVGLIYKQRDSLIIQPSLANEPPPFEDSIGYRVTQKIISYGK
jgi:hypothetical protein